MTADQVKGKGFKGALNYNLAKVELGVAKLLETSFASMDLDAVLKEVFMVKMLRPNLEKYFYHTSVNFPPEEDLPDEKMKLIAKEYLAEMGFGNNQFAVFRHFDADHPHLHILVNRIGYDGTVVNDSNNYYRSESILRGLEKKHGLTRVIGSRQTKERAMTKNELEMMKRTDEPSAKIKLQVILKSILNVKLTTGQFIQRLEEKGINVLFNQASTGFVSGISYGYEGLIFKGAHLGNAYKWQAVKTAIAYEQERDRAAIYEGNISTRAAIERRAGADGETRYAATRTVGRRQHEKTVQGAANDAVQGDGNLRQRIASAHQEGGDGTGTGRRQDIHSPAEINRDGNAVKVGTANPAYDRQQVAGQALPHLDLVGALLSPDNDADRVAQNEIDQPKRKKKKKGLRL